MITLSIMLATIMTVLDSTIANVALPHMAGSLSASADQISWVLTSYIIAAAIATPVTGWLTGRYGAKRLFMVMIVGFAASSALCGAAQSLSQIVAFRVLQGLFGAAMMPLSQTVLLDIYPLEQRGPVMAIWNIGTVTAPILGPTFGGWLTDEFSWRWVFYINIPFAAASVLGVLTFLPKAGQRSGRRFDVTGFAFLSIALAAFQLVLDRGQRNDWLQSPEISLEAAVAAVAIALFAFHTLTAEHPFLPRELMHDRNFVVTTAMSITIQSLTFSIIAILPTMMETLMGYPVLTTGLISSPRGIGAMISFMAVGWMIGRVDDRLLVLTGLTLFAISFWGMSQFSLQTSAFDFAWTGTVMGAGSAFIFMPMSVLGFATLAPELRADAAGLGSLLRNVGNGAGISMLEVLLTRNTAAVHSTLVEKLVPENPLTRALAAPFNLTTPIGLATLDGEATRQASMVAYIDIFHMLFMATLVLMPFALILKPPRTRPQAEMITE
jgi:DHA2 family multidrug resistance protein